MIRRWLDHRVDHAVGSIPYAAQKTWVAGGFLDELAGRVAWSDGNRLVRCSAMIAQVEATSSSLRCRREQVAVAEPGGLVHRRGPGAAQHQGGGGDGGQSRATYVQLDLHADPLAGQ